MERIRGFSNERNGHSCLSTSPVFERNQTYRQENENSDTNHDKNVLWNRKDGTPSFNKIVEKNRKLIPQKSEEMLEFLNQKNVVEKEEFNVSFTNENYNPMAQLKPQMDSMEKSKLSKNDIIINTKEQTQMKNQGPNKLIHLTETYNDSNKRTVNNKASYFKSKESNRRVVRQKFGSPIPTK